MAVTPLKQKSLDCERPRLKKVYLYAASLVKH